MGRLGKRGHQYSNRLRREATPVPPRRDDMWSGLAAALRTGTRPKTQRPFFSDANEAYRLLSALDVDARAIAPHLIARLPIEYAGTLLDIGGGLGTFAIAFCRRYPRLRATVLEHPRIAPLARRAVAASGLGTRIRVTGVDFTRRTLPRGFDTVFVSNVLHAHGAEENRSLVGKIRRCLNPGGRLIVRDVLVSRDGTRPEWAALFSVSLLLNSPRGRCYTLDDIAGWLRRSGFSRIQEPFRSSPLAFDPDSVLIAEM
jgi:cyclopropane fatty-acyl-phospholipid synthase-like methyltransferase